MGYYYDRWPDQEKDLTGKQCMILIDGIGMKLTECLLFCTIEKLHWSLLFLGAENANGTRGALVFRKFEMAVDKCPGDERNENNAV